MARQPVKEPQYKLGAPSGNRSLDEPQLDTRPPDDLGLTRPDAASVTGRDVLARAPLEPGCAACRVAARHGRDRCFRRLPPRLAVERATLALCLQPHGRARRHSTGTATPLPSAPHWLTHAACVVSTSRTSRRGWRALGRVRSAAGAVFRTLNGAASLSLNGGLGPRGVWARLRPAGRQRDARMRTEPETELSIEPPPLDHIRVATRTGAGCLSGRSGASAAGRLHRL